jgi:hypothetical protein
MIYDLFYVSFNSIDANRWKKFQSRFPLARKIENLSNFKQLAEKSFTKLFWVVWDDLDIIETFNFDYTVSEWDFQYVHVFKNGITFDGVNIFSKSHNISQKELSNRFFIKKKEINIVASLPITCQYDVVFISYNEPNADSNYNNLLQKFSNSKRVHGVKGIHQAHIAAANIATTEMFYVVDGDANLVNDFNFNNHIPIVFRDHVHVWYSRNPINDLVYGYGGVKLLPRDKTLNMDLSKTDMTTSISSKFKSIPEVSNITEFNTDPFNTWKSAFRECAKLSSKVIDRQKENETAERLRTWCSMGKDRQFGEYAIAGALAGKFFGESNQGNLDELKKINDFAWLEEKFNEI